MECWRFTNRLNRRVPIMALIVILVIFALLYSIFR